MSYIKHIDVGKTIMAAKEELNDFADLLKILYPYPLGDLRAVSYQVTQVNSGSQNYDEKNLSLIEKRDAQIKEVQLIINCLNTLEVQYVELLYLRHLQKKSIGELARMNKRSSSGIYRLLNIAYIKFAIAYGIEIVEDE